MVLTMLIALFGAKSARDPNPLKRLTKVSFWLMAEMLIWGWAGLLVLITSAKECASFPLSLLWLSLLITAASVAQWSLYILYLSIKFLRRM